MACIADPVLVVQFVLAVETDAFSVPSVNTRM